MKDLIFLAVLVVFLAQDAFADWPQFRGPMGQGHVSDEARLPVSWNEEENVVWKTRIPGSGWSSPVEADGRIWLTTATNKGRSLRAICVDHASGRMLNDIEIFVREAAEHVHSQNSHATPTPIIEGEHVYVHFGRNGTACVSSNGDIIWRNRELQYSTPHGSANSPVLVGELLIVCCDGSDKQFVAALSKHTGEIVWKHDRNHLEDARRKSREEKNDDRKGLPFIAFSTPLAVDVDGDSLLISTPADHVVANRVVDGEEVWWLPYNCFSLVARPVFGNGLVYAIGGLQDGHYAIYAIRPDAKGKVTNDYLVWTRTETVPQVPSPILVGDKLLLVKDSGIATCLNAVTGKELWQKRLGGNFRASPIVSGETVYAIDQKGKCHVFRLREEFKPLATNQLDGIFLASPAVVGNSLVLRSDEHLYRIENKLASHSDVSN